jgi:ParB-like chromosome segregation protein Spo0J
MPHKNEKAARLGGGDGLQLQDQLGEQINESLLPDDLDSLGEMEPIPSRRLSEIVIGQRHRKELGDLDELAASILKVGLLHPPVITTDNRLIAGHRRIAAWERLFGQNREIPVRVVPLKYIARGEAAENFARKDFTLSEAVAIKRAIEPELKVAAKERIVLGGKLKSEASAKLAQVSKGKERQQISAPHRREANYLGESGRSHQGGRSRSRKVRQAGHRDGPQRQGQRFLQAAPKYPSFGGNQERVPWPPDGRSISDRCD